MELNETVELMNSDDYKERFKGEFYQLQLRIIGLQTMLTDWGLDKLSFKPSCTYDLLEAQLNSMLAYESILKERARIEGIKL